MSCIVLHLCFIFIVSSPLFSPVDPETDAAVEYNYAPNNQTFLAELPGKQTPLIIPISPILSLPCLHYNLLL